MPNPKCQSLLNKVNSSHQNRFHMKKVSPELKILRLSKLRILHQIHFRISISRNCCKFRIVAEAEATERAP